jgi:hypothetical protein
MSLARVAACIYTAVGVLIMPVMLSVALIPARLLHRPASTFSIVTAVLAPIIYGVLGFVAGTVVAYVYNVVARRIGGVAFELEIRRDRSNSARR